MYERAMDLYGLEEIPGPENNPVIMQMFRDLGHDWVQGDETGWCACLINWLAWSLRLEHTNSLLARDFLSIGNNIQIPKRGHLAIFWRTDPYSQWGHVGLFVRKDSDLIYVLGGNQDNKIKISPYKADRLLGYRELRPEYLKGWA